MKILRLSALISAMLLLAGCADNSKTVKVLYWNVQNGMWSDQGNNYDNFVEFVKSEDPDICIWAEAETRYKTDTAEKLPAAKIFIFLTTGMCLPCAMDISTLVWQESAIHFRRWSLQNIR